MDEILQTMKMCINYFGFYLVLSSINRQHDLFSLLSNKETP